MKVFVSYSSKDRPLVEQLVQDLRSAIELLPKHQYSGVWYDANLKGGHNWWNVILNEIENCDLVICALTPSSIESRPCKLEREYAIALNKRILPVILSKKINPATLNPALQQLQVIYYTKRDIATYQQLIDALRLLPPPNPRPFQPPMRPDAPLKELGILNQRLEQPQLSGEEQDQIFHQLKEYLGSPAQFAEAKRQLQMLQTRRDVMPHIVNAIEAEVGRTRVVKNSQVFSSKLWEKYRKLPLWGQVVGGIAAFIALAYLSAAAAGLLVFAAIAAIMFFGAKWVFRSVVS